MKTHQKDVNRWWVFSFGATKRQTVTLVWRFFDRFPSDWHPHVCHASVIATSFTSHHMMPVLNHFHQLKESTRELPKISVLVIGTGGASVWERRHPTKEAHSRKPLATVGNGLVNWNSTEKQQIQNCRKSYEAKDS